MSATLQIRLIFFSIKFATLAQTLVTVRQVPSDNDTYPDAPFETATLLSRANNAHKIKVPQGTYKVEARFPNGTFARQICVVRDNETYHVKLPVEPARHSWLEWQTGTGNIALAIGDSPRSREVSDTQVKEDLQTRTNSHIQVSHLSYFLQRLPTDPASIGLTKRNPALNRQIENIAPWNLKKHITLPPTVVYATPNFMSLQPHFRSEMPFKHNSDDIVTLWSMHAIDQEQVSNTYRAVAVFSAKRRNYFAFLPDNWRLSNGQIASLEFLYDPTKQPGRELRISVVDSECVDFH